MGIKLPRVTTSGNILFIFFNVYYVTIYLDEIKIAIGMKLPRVTIPFHLY